MLRQIGIVGDAAAEIAIRHLALVDPPRDELPGELEILKLAERPQRHAGGRRRLSDGRHVFGAIIDVRPILPREDVFGIDAEQIGDVGEDAGVERFAFGGGVFLDQETPIVAHLIEPVGNVFGQSGSAVLEHQPDFRAVERGGIERRIGRGDAEIQAVVWQDAVAQIEPQRARRTGADRDRQIDHVARGPQRVLHPDVERDRGGALQRGQIERDAIEAVVEILPAIIERAGDRLIGIGIAEAGGDQDVDDRQARRAWARRCAGACRTRADRRLDARAWQRDDRAALVGGIAAGDEGFDRGERRDPGRSGGIDGERQFEAARRFGPGAHVIGPQLLDRLFLHRVDEAERAALPFGQRIDTAHHALRTGSDGGAVPKQRAIRRAADFDAVEAFARRDGEIIAFAAFDIDVPVG